MSSERFKTEPKILRGVSTGGDWETVVNKT